MAAPRLIPSKKFERISSAGKVIASIFWDNQGVINLDYLEKDCTINWVLYVK